MMKRAHLDQLHQLFLAGHRGVEAGDLADKCSTRELVRMGLADNGIRGGNPPSSLDRVYINRDGRVAYAEAIEGRHSAVLS